MPTSPAQRISELAKKTWLRRTAYGLLALTILFGLFGYFVLPGIIKSQAEKLVGEKLHRQLSIERIEFHPFSLELDIHGAKLLEADGKAVFVGFDLLHVDVSAKSLYRFAPVVQEMRLRKPYVHLVRTAANHYNFDDILKLIASQPASAPSAPARFAAYNLQIDDGNIEFDDQPEKTKHAVSELKVGVPFVSSLPSMIAVFTEPLVSAKINGAPFLLKGEVLPFAETKEATLALNLDDVDLTRYVEYLPFEPRFRLPSAKLDVHLTTVFHQPKGKSSSVQLKGTATLNALVVTELDGKPMLKLPKLEVTLDGLNVLSPQLNIARVLLDQPDIEVIRHADGSLNLEHLAPQEKMQSGTQNSAANEATTSTENPPAPALRVSLGELAVQDARVHFVDEQALHPVSGGVEKFELHINNTQADLQKQTVVVGSVTSSSAAFSLHHDKPRVGPAVPAKMESRPKGSQAQSGATTPGYVFTVNSIGIDNWSARLEDSSQPHAAVTTVSALKLDAKNISNAAGAIGHLDLAAGVNKQGQLNIAGDVGLSPLHTDLALNLRLVDLMPLQPYVTEQVNLLVTRAALSSQAVLKLDQAADGTLKGNFKGGVALNDLATIDKISSNDFVHWRKLAFDGMDVQIAPLAVKIDQIALDDFFARIIIDASGNINLQDIARRSPAESKSLTETTSAAPPQQSAPTAAAAPAKAAAMPPIKIRQVRLKGGEVRFSDNFIKPNYTAELMDLGGTVSGLSSDTASSADVKLQGKVNSAPLNIAGRVNPLKNDLSLDIKADVKGMELAPLSAYSGKYAGYGIEKGKLSFEVAYQLENRKLQAQNRLVLDQLTLGEKVDSPSATTLPVKLALSLLSDRNGVIDISLPIGGSLDDPDFSVGGIIVKVLVNLITKAATAPFALLGSMFGGGEELSWLEFDAGRNVVPKSEESKLTSLAKALNDRPALKLEVTGRFDSVADREGLRAAGIDRKVRAVKLKQLVAKGESADVNTLTVSAEEYPVLLAKVYKDEDFPKPRNLVGMQKALPVEEMEKLMKANAKVSDADLAELGNQRAQAVKDWLVKTSAVPEDRVFVVAAKATNGDNSKAKSSRVDFSLR